jgi:hypothetical protein
MGMIYTPHMVAGYPFEGNANDVSGMNNGTWVGNEYYEVGIIGRAAWFYSDRYIDCPAINVGGDKITISAWIKPNALGSINNNKQFVAKWDDDWVLGFENSNYNKIWWVIKNTAGTRSTIISPSLTSTDWVHVLATYNGAETKLYLNTELVASGILTGDIKSSNTIVRIGSYSSSSNIFIGLIDNVKIYNKALTQQEVKRDYLNLPIF